MIEPIKPGDDLFPYDIEIVEGKKCVSRKKDWSDYKQVALNLRTIEYLLQFGHNRGSISLINMIEAYATRAMELGDQQQRSRFRQLLELRDQWLKSRTEVRDD